MALNLEQARFNMVEQQVRTWDVLDPRVLAVLREVPREDFVPARYRKMAFADLRLPLACGQVMMRPVEEGRVLQALDVQAGQQILEIGTGSGFLSACLERLGAQVLSVELHQELADGAAERLDRLDFKRVTVRRGDALADALPDQLFDAVVVTASAAQVPEPFEARVRPGGALFAVRGSSPAMEAICCRRLGTERWFDESLFETDLPRLVGAEDRPLFQF